VCAYRPGSLQATLQYTAAADSSEACQSRGLASHIGGNHNSHKKIGTSSNSSTATATTASSATVGVKLELDARVRCSVQVQCIYHMFITYLQCTLTARDAATSGALCSINTTCTGAALTDVHC
jgi:hypothetical protein